MNTFETRPRPLYWRVADDITAKIESGVWTSGDKLPSERALCEQYGVSQITVRRALRELAHMGRVYSHHGLGWFVGRAPDAAEQVPTATLVLSQLDWLAASVVQCLGAELSRAGMALSLLWADGTPDDEVRALEKAVARGSDVALLMVTGEERRNCEGYQRLLTEAQMPLALLVREMGGLDVPAVVLDERSCMEQLTRHVLSLGHRRVAYVGGDPTLIEGQERYWGFATTLWESGLELPLDWVFSSNLLTDAEKERFSRIFESSYYPTVVICASDTEAAETIRLLQGMNLSCPDDVAVVGLGDRDFAPLLSPPLTTFRFDLEGLGHAAAALVQDLVAGRRARATRVSGRLVVRASCGAGLGPID
ncbi:MAG: GntR family transcriptional regulator [Anaerolineae bacterium]